MVKWSKLDEEGAPSSSSQPQVWTDESVTDDDWTMLTSPGGTFVQNPGERKWAARIVQRWYRKQKLKYGTYGPLIFTRKDGKIADFGKLSFSSSFRPTYFVRVSDTTSAEPLAHFLEKYWRLRRPDVLISVTGSAASIQITAQLQRVFDRGLAAAAAMTNAWIFTGGTDSGVMKLVGEAMHRGGLVDVPVVGIAPWTAVHGKSALEGCKGQEVHVRYKNADAEGRLNPHHSHQILVDAGPHAESWGSEIGLRTRLERTYAVSKGVPVVVLVVQGGTFTLDMMLQSAELGCPLLILSDSGGVASAIAQYCEYGVDAVDDPTFAGLEDKFAKLWQLHEKRGCTLLSFFRLQDEDSQNNMSSAILGALFRNLMFHQTGEAVFAGRTPNSEALSRQSKPAERLMAASAEVLKRYRDQMQRALLLTVKWNQPGFARRILLDLPPLHDHSRPLRKMLQHALEFQRVEIVRVLLERPGMESKMANLCQLYLLEDPYNFFRSDASLALKDRLSQNLAEIARDGGTQAFFESSYALYKRIVGPTLAAVAPHVYAAIEAQTTTTAVDLFFWAVFMGDTRLARELWAHCDHPLHCALLAAHLLRQLCKTITAARADAEAAAEEIESWAVGVLDEISEQELGHWLLSQKVVQWKLGSAINLALQMELKVFLYHRHCQSLMDLRWRGGYPDSSVVISPNHGPLQVFFWAFVLPLVNPYVWGAGATNDTAKERALRKAEKERRKRRGRHDDLLGTGIDFDDDDLYHVDKEELLLDALAEAFMQRKHEEQAAAQALAAEGKAADAKRQAAAKKVEAARQAEKAQKRAQVAAEYAQGGANTPADGTPERDALSKPKKVGPAAMFARTLSSVTLKRAKEKGYGKSDALLTGFGREKSAKHLGGSSMSLMPQQEVRAERPTRRKMGFYSVPLVKYLFRTLSHLLFLGLYAQVLTHLMTIDQLDAIAPTLPPLTNAELALVVWTITLGYEHRMRELHMRAHGLSTSLPLKTLVNLAYFTLVVAILMRCVTLAPRDIVGDVYARYAYVTYQSLVSFDSVLMMAELFTFMWTSVNFGVLTITLVQMMVDLSLFIVFFSVILIGFCLALIGLSETAPHEHHMLHEATARRSLLGSSERGDGVYDTADVIRQDFESHIVPEEQIGLGLVWQPFWAMYAEFDLDELSRIPFGLPVMWLYVLIANVVLVNMLIAMFADTYARIKKNAIIEYTRDFYLHVFEYQYVVRATPPPFNVLLLLWDTCVAGCRSQSDRQDRARMFLDDGYDEEDVGDYGAPAGMERHEGSQITRKFVLKYLKNYSDLKAATSTSGLARRMERTMSELEERVLHEFEHIHNALIAPTGSGAKVDQKLHYIAVAIDRMLKGKNGEASAAIANSMKESLRATGGGALNPAPGGIATHKAGPGGPPTPMKQASDRSPPPPPRGSQPSIGAGPGARRR